MYTQDTKILNVYTAKTHIIQCIYNLVVRFGYLKGCWFKRLKKNTSFCHSISAVTCFLLKSNQFQCQLKLQYVAKFYAACSIGVYDKCARQTYCGLHTCYITFNRETSLV